MCICLIFSLIIIAVHEVLEEVANASQLLHDPEPQTQEEHEWTLPIYDVGGLRHREKK